MFKWKYLSFSPLPFVCFLFSAICKTSSDNHFIYYCGQETLRRNGEAIIVIKRVQNAILDAILKMTEQSLSVHFQDKPFNITVIQVHAPTSNAEEAEVECFYETF